MFSYQNNYRPTNLLYIGLINFCFIIHGYEIAHSQNSLLKQADFDSSNAKISEFKPGYRVYTEDEKIFKLPFHGASDVPNLSERLAKNGTRSMHLSIGPSATGQVENDRSEFSVVSQGDAEDLHLGQDRYLGFSVLFNMDDFPPPTAEIIICQIWQSFKNSPTGPPAFIAMIVKVDDLSFRLSTRDDKEIKSSQVMLSHPIFLREAWNSVVLHLLPRAANDPRGLGTIELWLNGEYLGGANRAWGYASSNSIDAFDVRVGIYANPERLRHGLWIDRIRWGMTKAAVE